MTRLALPQVTLVSVDTRAPLLAAQALLRSMAGIDFARALLFTHDWAPRRPLPGIEVVDCGARLTDAERSHFMLRLMPNWVRTSHVLVIQWDGFVVEPWAWSNAFLTYDFVGALWPDHGGDSAVGQGGFSLRSRRLLAAGMDPRIEAEHPEDVVLTRSHRDFLQREHGVRFAPAAVSRRFAAGQHPGDGPTFGFLGAHNLPLALDEPTLATWLHVLPDDFFASREAELLARQLLTRRMTRLARGLIEQRHRQGRNGSRERLLSAAATVMGLLGTAPETQRDTLR